MVFLKKDKKGSSSGLKKRWTHKIWGQIQLIVFHPLLCDAKALSVTGSVLWICVGDCVRFEETNFILKK
jgi:hypothetical protein